MRFLSCAAVLGGALRISNTFAPRMLDAHTAQMSYALDDVALILGFIGFLLALRGKLSWLGLGGIALGIAGLLAVRLAAATGIGSYQMAAAATLFGTAFLGADMLMRHAGSRLAASAWLAALAAGLASHALPYAAVVAAALFGAGFICQGLAITRAG
jgi:hypothetical protein